MQAISDEKFVEWSKGLQLSDNAAYAALFETTYDSLFSYASYIVHDADLAHDVLQEVFLKLWQIRKTVDPNRSLKALLYQMVRNISLNHERRKKTHATDSLGETAIEPSTGSLIEEDYNTEQLGLRIERWIDEMPDRRREAFVLSRFEGLSHDEIARVMTLTPRTVNNHIVLALQYLRARMHEYDSALLES